MDRSRSDEDWRALLRGAFAMRAAAYAAFFDEMEAALGTERALAIGQAATRRLGTAMGERFAHLGPADLAGLREAFLSSIPDDARMFEPELLRCDSEALEIQFHRCPLKEAWEAQGIGGERLRLLCAMAGAIDAGLFERAGFTFAGRTWQPGESGCCRLRVLPGPGAAPATRA